MHYDRELRAGVERGRAIPRRRVDTHRADRHPRRERVHERLDPAAARREVVADDQDLRHLYPPRYRPPGADRLAGLPISAAPRSGDLVDRSGAAPPWAARRAATPFLQP